MMIFLSILVLWIISLCLHEYSHARVALAGGDLSVIAKGYLTMNPLRYLHPVQSIVIPLIVLAIGGIPLPGGAVYIDLSRIRSRHWVAAVSAAGPAANLALLILASLPFSLGFYDPGTEAGILWLNLGCFAFLQAFTVILNLLPVPGLDGFGILAPYLPYTWRRNAYLYSNTIMIMFIIVMINSRELGLFLQNGAIRMTDVLGIPRQVVAEGVNAFFDAAPRLF